MTALTRRVATAFYGNFTTLRDAQAKAIAPLLSGEDVLITATTGAGKTEAALAPLVDRLLSGAPARTGVTIMYVTPTRALANDLLRRLERPIEELGLAVGLRHGERNDLKRVRIPDVLITTPESLDVLLMRADPALQDVAAVIVDEIHLLYNTQRGLQLALLVERLQRFVAHRPQVCGLSATVADATNLWSFFWPSRTMTLVQAADTRPIDALIRVESETTRLSDALRPALRDGPRKILLFVDSKRAADGVTAHLNDSNLGTEIYLHHASLDRRRRLAVEAAFLASARAICVATSTLELGIDIGDIDLVVLYGRAPGWQSFLQRIGRGNRRAEVAQVLCLVPRDHEAPVATASEYLSVLSLIQHGELGADAPLELFGAALQQLASLVVGRSGAFVPRRELIETVSSLPHLTPSVIEQLLAAGIEAELFTEHPVKASIGPGPIAYELEDTWEIWSNFPRRSHQLELSLNGRNDGQIPATNLPKLVEGAVIQFGGGRFRVERVDRFVVHLVTTTQPATVEISYGGGHRTQDPTTLEELVRIVAASDLDTGQLLHPQTVDQIVTSIDRLRHAGFTDDAILWAECDGHFTYLTFAGELVNRLVAVWAQVEQLKPITDHHLNVEQPITFRQLPDTEHLASYLALAQRSDDDLTLYQQLLPEELRSAEFLSAFLRTPSYRRTLDRLRTARLIEVSPDELAAWVPATVGIRR